eukprot:1719847-Pyramimonas_sp.AAC.1
MAPAPTGPKLEVQTGGITEEEIIDAARRMPWGKSGGNDGVPGELWKAICMRAGPRREWALALCQTC